MAQNCAHLYMGGHPLLRLDCTDENSRMDNDSGVKDLSVFVAGRFIPPPTAKLSITPHPGQIYSGATV